MTPFRQLVDPEPGLMPGEAQDLARRLLPDRVQESSLGWWTPGQPRPDDDRVLLVGVAVWSGYDLNLLEHLNAAVASGSRPDVRVYVFDTDSVRSAEDFERIVPGIGSVHHTPVVGFWMHGELVEKACGYHGRQIVARVFGIDERLLHRTVTAAS